MLGGITIDRFPLGLRVLAALLLAVVVGIVLPAPHTAAWSDHLAEIAGTIGQLWLSALQMTVLPLVFCLLVTGLSRPTARESGGAIASRSMFVFGTLYLGSLVVAVLLSSALLQAWPVTSAAASAFRTFAAAPSDVHVLKAGEIIQSVIPSNVFAALAAGAILPVVVFAVLFGLAVRGLAERPRNMVKDLVDAIATVMFAIVGWVLLVAPIGVFGLIVATAHETGAAMLWGLASYLRFVGTIAFIFLLLSYPVAILWARVPLFKFALAAAPSQLVALSTQSSVGSLPVMLKSARSLGVDDEVANVTLPLAVSVFRFAGPVGTLTAATYAAAAAGVQPTVPMLVLAAALALLMEFAAVGLPNQVNLVALLSPVFAVLGAPISFIIVMLAVETIPDAIGTTANVSMDLASTSVVNRLHNRRTVRQRRAVHAAAN
jgi:Na+/H+-dicarboxylate symporter